MTCCKGCNAGKVWISPSPTTGIINDFDRWTGETAGTVMPHHCSLTMFYCTVLSWHIASQRSQNLVKIKNQIRIVLTNSNQVPWLLPARDVYCYNIYCIGWHNVEYHHQKTTNCFWKLSSILFLPENWSNIYNKIDKAVYVSQTSDSLF